MNTYRITWKAVANNGETCQDQVDIQAPDLDTAVMEQDCAPFNDFMDRHAARTDDQALKSIDLRIERINHVSTTP